MTNEELILRYKAGDNSALMELIKLNKGIVFKIADRYGRYMELEDCLQESYLFLIMSATDYDETQGMRYTTYLCNGLKWYLLRKSAEYGYIRMPAQRMQTLNKYKSIVTEYRSAHGKDPSDNYVMDCLQCSAKVLDRLKCDMELLEVSSLDSPAKDSDSEESTLHDIIGEEDCRYSSILDQTAFKDLQEELWRDVSRLPERRKQMLIQYSQGKTMEEIGKEYGITRGAVGIQIEKALDSFRRPHTLRKLQELSEGVFDD